MHNEVTGQHVRIDGLARQVVHLLDAKTSIEKLLEQACISLSDEALEALATALLSLVNLGLISLGSAEAQSHLQRQAEQFDQRKPRAWHNPLAVRFALLDPDERLAALVQAGRVVSVTRMVQLALLLLLVGFLVAAVNTQALGEQLAFMARSPHQWWQMIVVYPFLKCLHEFAHAIAVKRFGGAVHEMGITLLVLMPVPYVDASDSWRIESRRRRILVSAAGMLAEGVVASLALVIWSLVEPGLIHEMAFALALTGSLSAVLFNANPLLKFDGYQILQDLLDIPNLAPRATRYLRYLLRRYLLNIKSAVSPVSGMGERRWLFLYGVSAGVYRWVITMGIALYLATRFPILGSLLAIFALYQLAVKPLFKGVGYLAHSSELAGQRTRGIMVSSTLVAMFMGLVFLVPMPTSTRAQGVVSVPVQARLYAPQSGEIASLNISDGQLVLPGQLLLTLNAPVLNKQLAVAQSELEVLKVQVQAALSNDKDSASSYREDLQEKRKNLAALSDRVASLQVRAGAQGTIKLDSRLLRVGQFVEAGASLGHIVNQESLHVKAVVRQSDISRVKAGVDHISVRLAEQFSQPLEATLIQQTPAGDRQLPSQALAGNGPGAIAVASGSEQQWETVEPVFHLELELPAGVTSSGIGGRAYVTLTHQAESLGSRSWRSLRQLLLDQLAI
ncbi:Putative peptide zinc metalloprotease protein YydH [Granulosicoccus antarcticus IMCC3135]|uniref:Peptide zinc metalloprotease protein YydH n=2 Tax=Granulosicoccus TaxID=437504 RepID=A0A2Z2NZY9_9GAMM|nr:Putative peptide zinc metalloprotease protein YydH [Granulosicoccus antarcticus IMCC3135]